MEHFYQPIPGWFDYLDVYHDVVSDLPDGAHIVELGAWQGKSTAGLAVEIANSGKAIRLDVVDHFQGSTDSIPGGAEALPDLRERFYQHTAPVRHLIHAVHEEPSIEAAKRYAPESLDFVWIDGSHDSSSVLADLEAWWPAVKPGGQMGGHDADWPTVQHALRAWSRWRGVEPEQVSVRSWMVRKPVPLTDWSVPAGQRKCLVAVASNERMVYRQTVQSLVSLGWGERVTKAATRHGFSDVQFTWVHRHPRVDDLRNEAAQMAIGLGASHLLFLDSDMTWPATVLSQMLSHHDRGMVAGLYFLKRYPHQPVALHSGAVNLETGQVDYLYVDAGVLATELQPVSLVGMGCTLIPMALCRAMEWPWFEYRADQNGIWSITEDVSFCQKAAAFGCPIWLDPTIRCGHLNSDEVTDEHFFRARMEDKFVADFKSKQRAKLQAVPA